VVRRQAFHRSGSNRALGGAARLLPRRPTKQDRLPCYDCCDSDEPAD
jgi:hypothetical protein